MSGEIKCSNEYCKSGEPGQEAHTCPYSEEIHEDYETKCTCCEDCEYECCQDI